METEQIQMQEMFNNINSKLLTLLEKVREIKFNLQNENSNEKG